MNENKLLKLHLGCGETYLEGYTNIDYPQDQHSVMKVRADKYADIRTLQYPDNSVDEIRSHHMFEHFNRAEALALLARWRRWLKPGGALVIETPDFAGCALSYTFAFSRKRRLTLGRHAFGSQEAPWAIHYDFWDASKFKYVLKKFGFKKLRVNRYANSVAKHFPKIPFLNILGNLLPDSMYEKYGGHKLPNILVRAMKSPEAIDERKVAREILSEYLVGRENDALLNVWLNDFK